MKNTLIRYVARREHNLLVCKNMVNFPFPEEFLGGLMELTIFFHQPVFLSSKIWLDMLFWRNLT